MSQVSPHQENINWIQALNAKPNDAWLAQAISDLCHHSEQFSVEANILVKYPNYKQRSFLEEFVEQDDLLYELAHINDKVKNYIGNIGKIIVNVMFDHGQPPVFSFEFVPVKDPVK